ncbi:MULTISPECIES: hypothetical protein [Sorangium]|uniref:Secreted protein n=1 Tax=Sorangium cellulosum TaxID=56 RepID=A0A4P2R595_SORCE|nr:MULTISPECIES: hypothetical protein [Sorangium]AUX37956.1 uncharacterized protein SOCE836_101940 [Sorangium cellulosum]WCQ97243.1 hypothetical protein NQZ70_10034 [Sorangium sp. Soce836]
MNKLALLTSAAAVAVATLGFTGAAHAQERTRDTVTITDSVPNRGLIWSGVAVLGTTYGISTVVATFSDKPADRALWVPIAGPWIDLGSRGKCGGDRACNTEATNKVLLVADGLGQAIGALQILSGFIFPAKRTVTEVGSVQIIPMGKGLAARTVF